MDPGNCVNMSGVDYMRVHFIVCKILYLYVILIFNLSSCVFYALIYTICCVFFTYPWCDHKPDWLKCVLFNFY